jgi:F-type H+-transporting ATPase subunit delta
MPSRASATRYARALFDVALKESDPVRIERDVVSFEALMSGNAELQGALTNPAIPVAAKRKIVDTLARRLEIAAPAHKLLLLLADRDRLTLVPDLVAVYRERLRDHQQVVRAEVTTASPLTPDRAAQLQKQLADITGRTVEMTTSVDPAIIGGVVTRIGGTVYDGSLATQLAKLREKLAV